MTGGGDPGWYPDYEAPAGHQRYWDGEQWTERRSTAAAPPPKQNRFGVPPWILVAVAVLVVVSALAIVLGNRETGPSGATPPGPASTPGPPGDDGDSPTATPDNDATVVASVVDDSTLALTDGTVVRLLGIADSCGEDELTRLVVGHEVTLIPGGVDQDSDGALLQYVERDGLDVGKRLIQKGLAHAADTPNPRRAIYRRLDARSADQC